MWKNVFSDENRIFVGYIFAWIYDAGIEYKHIAQSVDRRI